MHIFPCSG